MVRKYLAITTFHKQGYIEHAEKMMRSFEKHWPREISLLAYYEEEKPNIESDRIFYRSLNDSCPNLLKFKERHKDDRYANGWDDRKNKVNFALNAVRFSHKSYCMAHACVNPLADEDVVIWLDSDTHTFRDMPFNFIDGLMGPKYCNAFLGRKKPFTETGYIMFNVKHRLNDEYMKRWNSYYNDDTIFQLPNYTDCEVFDTIRRKFLEDKDATDDEFLNLSPVGNFKFGHPFINSMLGQYMDHCKGNRKFGGTSGPWELRGNPESQAHKNKQLPYWQKAVYNKKPR